MGLFNLFKEKKGDQSFHFGNLIELLQDGVCISNLNGNIIYLNEAGYRLLRIPRETDLNQLNIFEDLLQDDKKINKIKKMLHTGNIVNNLELQIVNYQEETLDVLLTVNSLSDYRQQPIGFLFLIKDITEIKKMQQQLLQSQKLESVGLMASGIAHDFNNILAAIIPNAELIKMSEAPESVNYKRAEIIEKSAHRASGIAKKLLTFTRDQEQQKRPLNLNHIIKESLELIQNSLPKNIKVELDLEDDLYTINADAIQMEQVVMNLLINARDALPNGGQITLTTRNKYIEPDFIEEESQKTSYYVQLEISDNGIGIPIENLPKIFDPFFTTKEIGKGTGLGLSMVYGIVKGHNGTINVFSEPGKGTRFEILLPAEETRIKEKMETSGLPELPRNLKFLIVDDEQYVRDILADILIFLGSQVLRANSGKEAIEIYNREKDNIDYVIIDIRMPKMDGRTTLYALQQINPDVKAIFTSGYDDRHSEDEVIPGVVGFMRKPYSINNVSKFLQQVSQMESTQNNSERS